MGNAQSREGGKRFGLSLLNALPGVISGGLAGSAMGPQGAAMGALSGLIPGIGQGIQAAVSGRMDPRGPQNASEALGMLGQHALETAHSALMSPIFHQGVGNGIDTMSRFTKGVKSGKSMRAAYHDAGGESWHTAMGQAIQNSARNKFAGIMGIDPQTAVAHGNPVIRQMMNQSKSSVHRLGTDAMVGGIMHSLATTGLAAATGAGRGGPASLPPTSQTVLGKRGMRPDEGAGVGQAQIPAGGTSIMQNPGGVTGATSGYA